jgi:hypothetical protein
MVENLGRLSMIVGFIFTPLSCILTAAFAAVSTTLSHVRVLWRIFMASGTVGYCCGALKPRFGRRPDTDATSKIHNVRDQFEMPRVDTGSHAAEMIWLQSYWDRPAKFLIRNAMRWPEFIGLPNPSVSINVQCSEPEPAAALGNWDRQAQQTVTHGRSGIAPCHSSILPQLCNSERI